jgi:hypothetical protein
MGIRIDELDGMREGIKKLKLIAIHGKKMETPVSPKRSRRPPFAQIPIHWFPIIIHANAFRAIPLLGAIAYQMKLACNSHIPITSKTWAFAGYPRSKDQRRAMLAALNRIPSIVRLKFKKRTGSKYVAYQGLRFDNAPPEPSDEGDDFA